LNQDCDDDENRYCESGLICSRGTCIKRYSIPNGGRCADSDCSEGYCDEYLKTCTRTKSCAQTNGDVIVFVLLESLALEHVLQLTCAESIQMN
jgi:hypothetical protein